MLESEIFFFFFASKGLFSLQWKEFESPVWCLEGPHTLRHARPLRRRPLSRCLEPGPWPAQGVRPAAFRPDPLPGRHPSGPTEKPDSPQCCGLSTAPTFSRAPGRGRAPQNQACLSSHVPGAWHGASGLSHECLLPSPSWLCLWLHLCGPLSSSVKWGRGSTCAPGAAVGGKLTCVSAETGRACGVAWKCRLSLPRLHFVRCLHAGAWREPGDRSLLRPLSRTHGRQRPPRDTRGKVLTRSQAVWRRRNSWQGRFFLSREVAPSASWDKEV